MVLGSLPVLAQSNPSADQIINSLRPSGNLVMGGTRGIRLAPGGDASSHPQPGTTPATPQPRVAASKPVAVPAAATTAPSVNLTVNFANGSAELTPAAINALDELG